MAERIKMNSENLQTLFPEVYRELFSKCSIVASAPSLFHWAGEYAMNFGGPVVSQKIPLRVYVGIEPTGKKNQIEFGKFLLYLTSKRSFSENSYYEYLNKKTQEYLKEAVVKMNGGGDFDSFRVNAIFEVPKYSGLNSSAAFLSALMLAVMLFLKKISLEDYNKSRKMPVNKLIDFDKFDFIFREAWKMNSAVHHGISSGASIFGSMVNSKYPIVYFTDKRGDEGGHFPYKLSDGQLGEIDEMKYSAFDLGDFFGLEKMPAWNIDFGLIYSGGVKPLNRVSRAISNINDSLKSTVDFAETNNDGKKLLSFYNKKKNGRIDEIRDSYISSLSYLTLDIIKSIKENFSQGRDDSLIHLFRSINLYDNMMYFLSGDFVSANHIGNSIREDAAKDSNGIGIATKICGVGRGGDVLFVGPGGSLFAYINDIMSLPAKDISLDYLSWEDGYEKNGLLVEQFIDAEIYSKFISHDVVRILALDEKNTLQSNIISKEQLDKDMKSMDLLLDKTKGDIFIRGKALNSKEIFSSRYTVDFLDILLKSPNQEVSNKDLPPSSYSSNRNEFQSKILKPLKNEIKKKAKRDLNISISGTPDDFKLKLKSGNCIISILEKVF